MSAGTHDLTQRLRDPATRRDAFAELVRQSSPRLYRQIRRIVLFHDDADDVMQETYLKAWQALDDFRGEAQVSTWLYRIAMNEALSFIKKQREHTSLESEESDVARTLESDPYFDGDQLEARFRAAIARLPDKQRLVFNLRYFDNMPYEEMSRLLGNSEGALKASYHFATLKLKAYIENLEM